MSKQKNPVKRIKKANNFIFSILRCFFVPVLRIKYNFKFDRKSSKNIRRPCLILCNHQVGFDIFALGSGFKFGVNFVARDSLFRRGLGSSLMKALVRPIPISKGSTDSAAVRQMISVIKDGGAVAMFPSGNRSFFGNECAIDPGISKLAKKLGVPLVLCQIRGGFFTKARWNKKPSKGKVRLAVERVISVEELSNLSHSEIYAAIKEVLDYNEFEWNKKEQLSFKGRRKAEYLESALFWCPSCNSMTDMHSFGNDFFCGNCGVRVTINKTGFFEMETGGHALPGTIVEWGEKQLEYVKNFDYSPFTDKPVFSDGGVNLFEVERAKKQELIGCGSIELYADKLVVCGKEFPITKIRDMSVESIYRFNVYAEDGIYTVEAPDRTNLFKYMVCGYVLKNAALGTEEEYYGY